MKIRMISVSYGQTLKGDIRFEGERWDMTVTMETETEEEQAVRNLRKNGRKILEEVRGAVESKTGRKMRRNKDG